MRVRGYFRRWVSNHFLCTFFVVIVVRSSVFSCALKCNYRVAGDNHVNVPNFTAEMSLGTFIKYISTDFGPEII